MPVERNELQASVTLYLPNLAPSRHNVPHAGATLGRSNDCTIPVRDRFLSRKHAEVFLSDGKWMLRDWGSANGTFLNGSRVSDPVPIASGDRINMGDAEIVFHTDAEERDSGISVGDFELESSVSLTFQEAMEDETASHRKLEGYQILNSLAIELIEDRPLDELLDFIVDRVFHLLNASRAAVALLSEDLQSFVTVKLRRDDVSPADLQISKTLLEEVAGKKRVISFDTSDDSKLGQALSIIGQSIRCALCAPVIVRDTVVGVLYVDFLTTQPKLTQENLSLVAQIARFAAAKLETTRLREEAVTKKKLEEEIQTAFTIQSRLLPSAPLEVAGYTLAGVSHPCRTVSGDFFDYVHLDDGKICFIIADVSGKGITAAIVMASLATAFSIFAKGDPTPAGLVSQLNESLVPKLAPSKFVTLVIGKLDPATGTVEYANAGHVPPLHVSKSGVTPLRKTDRVVGLFPATPFTPQSVQLDPGDALVLFTDGITEAENAEEEELGTAAAIQCLEGKHCNSAQELLTCIEERVHAHIGNRHANDDITIVTVSRNKAN